MYKSRQKRDHLSEAADHCIIRVSGTHAQGVLCTPIDERRAENTQGPPWQRRRRHLPPFPARLNTQTVNGSCTGLRLFIFFLVLGSRLNQRKSPKRLIIIITHIILSSVRVCVYLARIAQGQQNPKFSLLLKGGDKRKILCIS